MKTLGLIGGMSWESTVPYYRPINERVQQRLGGLHSAKLILHSVDFHDIEQLQAHGSRRHSGFLKSPSGYVRQAQKRLSSAPTPCTRWPTR